MSGKLRKLFFGCTGLALTGFTLYSYNKPSQTINDKKPIEPVILDPLTVRETNLPSDSDYECIICGAGTGGCFIAYLLAKWMKELGIPGKVLLLERGDPYIYSNGPHPRMDRWYNNWGAYAVTHETSADTWEPFSASSHIGVGGCGAHDTRISFVPSDKQSERFCKMMNYSRHQFDSYKQTILNIIPLETTLNFAESFFDAVVDTLSKKTDTLTGINYETQIVPNSVGYVSVAMYPDETRWTSAYLLEDGVRPSNLEVLTNATVDKVLFQQVSKDNGQIKAVGVSVVLNDGTHKMLSLSNHGEVVLANGSLGVPAILQRSGIGPSDHLKSLNIEPIIANDEVGHGVDHIEGCVQYKYLEKWRNKDGSLPRGGPMDWPIVFFGDNDDGTFFMCHFGISPPPYDRQDVLATPNVTQPNQDQGFRVFITSTDPTEQAKLVHSDIDSDFKAMSKAVIKTVSWFEVLKDHSVVGERIQPPLSININDPDQLESWLRQNMGTVFHWMSTCKAGEIKNSVADNRFIVRNNEGFVQNLRLGSGAVLPEISEANPHMTISTFSVALAHQLLIEKSLRHNIKYQEPNDLRIASETIKNNNGNLKVKKVDEVTPDLREIAKNHRKLFE